MVKYKTYFVIGIIILFLGASVTPNLMIKTVKANCPSYIRYDDFEDYYIGESPKTSKGWSTVNIGGNNYIEARVDPLDSSNMVMLIHGGGSAPGCALKMYDFAPAGKYLFHYKIYTPQLSSSQTIYEVYGADGIELVNTHRRTGQIRWGGTGCSFVEFSPPIDPYTSRWVEVEVRVTLNEFHMWYDNSINSLGGYCNPPINGVDRWTIFPYPYTTQEFYIDDFWIDEINQDSNVLFYDDFSDNTKDYSKWSQYSGNGLWEETNQRTEIYLDNYENDGIVSEFVPITISESESVNVSFNMISNIASSSDYGQIQASVTDGYNSIIINYWRLYNTLQYLDTNGSQNWIVLGYREDGIWGNTIEIYNNRYRVKMDTFDSGWIYDSMFSSADQIKLYLIVELNVNSRTLKGGYDSVLIQGQCAEEEQHPVIFAVDGGKAIWSSTDQGENWTEVNPEFDDTSPKAMVSDNSGNLYIVTGTSEISKSSDHGENWTIINNDYNGDEVRSDYLSMACSKNNDYIYIIEKSGDDIWRSNDSGVTWVKVNDNYNGDVNPQPKGADADSDGNIFVVDGNADVWKSTDFGMSWTKINDDYNGPRNNYAADYVIGDDMHYIVMGVGGASYVYKSTDDGETFTDMGKITQFGGAQALSYSNGKLYGVIFYGNGPPDIYQSDDGATSWGLVGEISTAYHIKSMTAT